MTVEVEGFEMVQGPVEIGVEGDKSISHKEENGKLEQHPGVAESLKFGSHGDESANAEGNGVSDLSVPKDATEEWSAPKQIHSFYFVRHRLYDDPSIKPKVDKLDKEITQKNQARIQINDALKAKWSERAELISQINSLKDEKKQFQSIIDEKIKEIGPLQQALGKLRTSNNAGRGGLCSSEEELNDILYSLQYRIQHESIPLSEEKQILREIKQLEGTREKVIANAAMKAKVQDSIGKKEAIEDQVKLIGGDFNGLKKERQAIQTKIKQLENAKTAIEKDIQSLQEEIADVIQKRDKAFEGIQQLRKQRDEGNACYFQSRKVLSKARDLATNKDINALQELSHAEVEKFMSLWSSDRAFRDDYEKRILPSLDSRQLSIDGRMRNPDEKPLLEEPKPAEKDTLLKSSLKQPKEEPKASPQETLPTQKDQKETKNKGRDLKPNLDNKDLEDTDEYEFENPRKETPVEEPPIDPAKLKEIKREEEIAKAKLALERKKKLAEKAAAKAAIKAQKDAEKKLKEREKKAKKATAGSAPGPNAEEPADEAAEATEQEKVNDNAVEASAPVKEKVPKESNIRFRSRTKGPESIPKVILKRKKSNNYWVWVASSALLVLIMLVLVYSHLS